MNPKDILTIADCEKERTPAELVNWVDEKNAQFRAAKDGSSYLLRRKGLAKKFVDKLYPLSHLAWHLFAQRVDVVCKPNLSEGDCDAVVVNYRDRPVRIQKIEIRQAILCYEEYLRKIYFLEKGQAATLGQLTGGSKKGSREAGKVEVNYSSHKMLLEKGLELIADAAWSEVPQHYEQDTLLAIVFDDYASFKSEEDLSVLEKFVSAEVLTMDLDFTKLFLLGWSGSALLGFSLGREVVSKGQPG